MKVVWSDDAVWALVALETRPAQRYSSDKAARIVEELDRLENHPQLGRVDRDTFRGSSSMGSFVLPMPNCQQRYVPEHSAHPGAGQLRGPPGAGARKMPLVLPGR